MDTALLKRTCVRQLKFRGLLCFLYAAIFSFLIFSFSQFEGIGKWGFLLSAAGGFIPVFVVQCILIIRFFQLIRRQERRFGVYFSDMDARPLWKNAPIFVTGDWCILGGTAAFYYEYIKDVTWRYERSYQRMGSYYLIVKTIDGHRYRFWLVSKSGCAKVRRWWKNRTGENGYGI